MTLKKSALFIVFLILVVLFSYTTHASVRLVSQSDLISPAEQAGFSGTVVIAASGLHSAKFSISGLTASHGRLRVREAVVKLSKKGLKKKIKVHNWSYGGALTSSGELHERSNSTGNFNNLLVGASITIPDNMPSGKYVGQAHLQLEAGSTREIVPFEVLVLLLAKNSVSSQRDMVFPAQTQDYAHKYILRPGDMGSAMFSATGEAGKMARAFVIPKEVQLKNKSGVVGVRVSDFKFAGDHGAITTDGVFRFPSGLKQTVVRDIMVGATASYALGVPAGLYQGTAVLRVVYR